MIPQKITAIRKDLQDHEGGIIEHGGIDDMLLHHWGVHPVSMRDSDGTWRFHMQTVAFCSDKTGKMFMVDPEAITIVQE